jgi:dynein heavy chain
MTKVLQVIPVIEEVANPALKPRHWKQIFDLMGRPYSPEMTFSTNELLSFNIMDKLEDVSIPL